MIKLTWTANEQFSTRLSSILKKKFIEFSFSLKDVRTINWTDFNDILNENKNRNRISMAHWEKPVQILLLCGWSVRVYNMDWCARRFFSHIFYFIYSLLSLWLRIFRLFSQSVSHFNSNIHAHWQDLFKS